MDISCNSVFEVTVEFALPTGRYRVLDYFASDELFCVFKLDQGSTQAKPLVISSVDLLEAWRAGKVRLGKDELPRELLMSDKALSPRNISFRDENYELINPLISNSNFLRDYTLNSRSRIVVEHAASVNVRPLKVYRALAKFWTYGQIPNALLMFTSKCGGKGKQKANTGKIRGRPLVAGRFIVRQKQKVNITEHDKESIRREVMANLSPQKKFTYALTYDFFKKNYYAAEIESANAEQRPAKIPTLNQFIYWAKKLVSREKMIRQRVSDSVWGKDYEGFEGSVSENIKAPGMRYELDSTIADVYLVCEFNRELVLGRPTLYFVVDTASRMIAGLHISLEFASWKAARQAVFNACSSKVEFCKRYGIEINESDWPCSGTPARLLCDRAEMLGEKAEKVITQVGATLEFAPPYRGDFKAIVERRFGITNEVIHILPGTTLAQLRKRGEKDCRLNAALSIKAFTEIILLLCIEHNKDRSFDYILNRELVEGDLNFTPLNYWKLFVSKHQHAIKKVSAHTLIARLMDEGTARVSENGIVFKGRRYLCEKYLNENWGTQALNRGSWKVECRSDESWTTDIYIRETDSSEYIQCYLMPADELYSGLHDADVVYLNEWRKSKAENASLDKSKVDRLTRLEEIVSSEVLKTKSSPKVSNRAKVVNIRKNRLEHLESQKPVSDQVKPVEPKYYSTKARLEDALLGALQQANSEEN